MRSRAAAAAPSGLLKTLGARIPGAGAFCQPQVDVLPNSQSPGWATAECRWGDVEKKHHGSSSERPSHRREASPLQSTPAPPLWRVVGDREPQRGQALQDSLDLSPPGSLVRLGN